MIWAFQAHHFSLFPQCRSAVNGSAPNVVWGVEGASAAFSRGTSLASDAEMPFAPQVSAQSAGSPVSPIRELPELKEAIMVQAKGWKIW